MPKYARAGPSGDAPALEMKAFDLVEPALLVPPDCPIRGGSRPDAARVLDRELVALAGAEQHARFLQARLAARMMEIRGWKNLGFARLADYACERLGLSPRTLEEDARVVHRLAELPILDEAARAGLLPWTRLRLLVAAATPEDQEVLLVAALKKTTRQLQAFLQHRAAPVEKADGAAHIDADAERKGDACADTDAGTHAAAQVDAETEADPHLRWDIPVSRSGRRQWRAACELASRSAGSPLSQAQILELVCAEAVAGPPRPGVFGHWIPEAEVIETRILERRRGQEARGRRYLEAFRAQTGVVDGFAWLESAAVTPGPSGLLDSLLEDLAELGGAAPAAPCKARATPDPSTNLGASVNPDASAPPDNTGTLDAFELDRRLRSIRMAMQRLDAQIATLLRIGADRRLFRELGFASVQLYVESRLGMSARKAWGLIAIERASWRTGLALREAWRLGEISSLAASALLPVISEKYGRAWIQRAREVTLRRLHDEVAWALDHGDRHPSHEPPAPPPPDTDVRADTSADITIDEVQMRAHGPTPDDVSMGPPGAVRLSFRVPLSVAVLAETAIWLLKRPGEPRWRTFERITALAVLEWSSVPRHRDPVFERDGWRCAVPGCSSRRNLHDHHVMYRSHGGGNARDNRVTVCAAHHLHGIHAGIVRARGRAPDAITWELGCRRGQNPLMRLRGDRYERDAPPPTVGAVG